MTSKKKRLFGDVETGVVATLEMAHDSSNDVTNRFYNQDCITGAQQLLADNSVDFVLCDPPFGIDGGALDKHYNRTESKVLGGYVEVKARDYATFSAQWIREAARVLKPGAWLCVVSGFSQLHTVLEQLDAPTNHLQCRRHIVWRYAFGVWTTKKFISSHYHVLIYEKKREQDATTNAASATSALCGSIGSIGCASADDDDADSVWMINREYQTGTVRNQNQLPTTLVRRLFEIGLLRRQRLAPPLLQERMLACDFFLGSFTTARVANQFGINAVGFEVNSEAFDYWSVETERLRCALAAPPTSSADTGNNSKKKKKRSGVDSASLNASLSGVASSSSWMANAVLPVTDGKVDLVVTRLTSVPDVSWFDAVCARLRNGGSFYLVVSAEQVGAALRSLHAQTNMFEINHIIWRFGAPVVGDVGASLVVSNSAVFASSSSSSSLQVVATNATKGHAANGANRTTITIANHLHVLFWEQCVKKVGQLRTFNTYAVVKQNVKTATGGSANYADREDVWWHRDENRALTWREVLAKIVCYSSNKRNKVANFCAGDDVALEETCRALGRVYTR
jgi:site-specific DNA-methyltransferase (adenine-specific)